MSRYKYEYDYEVYECNGRYVVARWDEQRCQFISPMTRADRERTGMTWSFARCLEHLWAPDFKTPELARRWMRRNGYARIKDDYEYEDEYKDEDEDED